MRHNQPASSKATSSAAADRRVEARYTAEGEVCFSFEDLGPRSISGRLADYSNSGFRAIHTYPALTTGQEVNFEHQLTSGRARVMWNRIQSDSVETGFLILAN